METTLIFRQGIDLPCFASFILLKDALGVAALRAYFAPYVDVARRQGVGLILDSPTWRANRDWGARLGYAPAELDAANRKAVEVVEDIRSGASGIGTPIVVNGCVGPRGDGYRATDLMTVAEAENYHAGQVRTFSETAADMVTALTMTYSQEAIGVIRAATSVGMPVVISFTVETDGRLPSGQSLKDAIEQVDAETGGAAAYFMINCAHPTHFDKVLEAGEPWLDRIGGLRANASAKSHAELDEADELDAGNPTELAAQYSALRGRLRSVRVVGGCCGTDHRHIEAICSSWLQAS